MLHTERTCTVERSKIKVTIGHAKLKHKKAFNARKGKLKKIQMW